MDVRCEKCQTEYELDESRLKPGGVTVKCTNCGHMFKIRKRTPTNVGVPVQPAEAPRARTTSSRPPATAQTAAAPAPAAAPAVPRAASNSDAPLSVTDQGSGPNSDRQWLIRLENGEQKACRELAMLQQWIVAGVVTRESLISRSGKTWKRLGDITELGQYFVIADEARVQRSAKPTGKAGGASATVMGIGANLASAGDSASDEDDLERRTTGAFRARPKTQPPPPPAAKPNPLAQTELAPAPAAMPAPASDTPPRRPPTQPPPVPKIAVPQGERATAAWASADIKTSESMAAMPQGPRSGKVSAIPNEPAFSGRVRMEPGDESAFKTGKVRALDDEDDLLPSRRGSRAGMWIALFALLVIGGAAGVVYMVVFKPGKHAAGKPTAAADAGAVAVATPDATAAVPPPAADAAAAPATSPLDAARGELTADVEPRLKGALESLAGKDDPAALALRARLTTALAQAAQDRAGLVEKAEGDKLRKEAKQIVIDAAPLAQRAFKAQADDASANLAMADVLRLQGKPAHDVRRYLDTAKAKTSGDKELARSVALAEAQLAMREGKLDEARSTLAAIDAADDNRVKFALALVAFTQNRPADAKPIVEQLLAAQGDHDGARALSRKLETAVASTDPLPPEDPTKGSGATPGSGAGSARKPDPGTTGGGGGGGDYDALLAKANKLAETNCGKAMELFTKALELKSNGVEALTGMGYCYLDAKQFSSAFSKFRTALMVSSRYEPALGGVAETYQRQGNKEQAIESWRKYLEIYPGSAKAKKQLELLGASAEGGGGGSAPSGGGGSAPSGGGGSAPSGGGEGSAAPPPAPPPAPAPAPAPAAAGSGSG